MENETPKAMKKYFALIESAKPEPIHWPCIEANSPEEAALAVVKKAIAGTVWPYSIHAEPGRALHVTVLDSEPPPNEPIGTHWHVLTRTEIVSIERA